jgi:hypothetical protein
MRVQVLALTDISKRPDSKVNTESSGRIMDVDDDSDAEDNDLKKYAPKKRMLKLVLRDEQEKLILAIEHDEDSVPASIKEGDWLSLNYSLIEFNRNIAFLLRGALTK